MPPRLKALHLAALVSLLTALAGGPLPAVLLAAPAAGFVVNSGADAPDANLSDPACETATPSQCTLRAAIQQANFTPGPDTITFSVFGAITFTGTSPLITDTVSIVGPGTAALTLDAAGFGSVLRFNGSGSASFYLEGLTLTGGFATTGGGVYLVGNAPLVISDTVLTGNVANSGGGVSYDGGGASLQIINSDVLTNTAGNRGGGVSAYGRLEVTNSLIQGNLVAPLVASAEAQTEPQGVALSNAGGGLYAASSFTVTDSLVLGNHVTGETCAAAASEPSGVCAAAADPAGFFGTPAGAGIAVDGGLGLVRGSTLAGNYFSGPLPLGDNLPAGVLIGLGGGMINHNGLVLVRDTLIDDNSAYMGAGFYNHFGDLALLRVQVSDNNASFAGGGVFSESGPLGVSGSLFRDNWAYTGAGGGLYFLSGVLTVQNTEFDFNGAGAGGGGLAVANSAALIAQTSVHHGSAGVLPVQSGVAAEPQAGPADGGGLLLMSSAVVLNRSAVYSNTADNGGGIANSGILTMTNTTVSGNSATNHGGGVYLSLPPASAGVAGGIGTGIQALLRHVTLAGNLADSDNLSGGNGGGIFVSVNLTATFSSTLVAQNLDNSGEAPDCAGSGTYVSTGYNLWTDTDNCSLGAATGDQYGVAAGILPLQDNGGPTPTHGLMFGSLALDTADPGSCLPNDQRGAPRPFGPNCDIGAFELSGIFVPIVTR